MKQNDICITGLRPLTHVPETVAISSTQDSGAFRADARLLTSLTAFSIRKTGTGIWRRI